MIRTVIASAGILDDIENIALRTNLCWSATVAINGWASSGHIPKGWDAHTLEHDVGAYTDCAHGAGLAVIQPAWLYFLNEQDPTKFVQFAKNVFGIEKGDLSDREVGIKGIDMLKEAFRSWGLPMTLRELNVGEEMLPVLAEKVIQNPEGQDLSYDDVLAVLKSCF